MYKKLLLTKCLPYKKLGYKMLEDGTELFGNDTAIAPQAWLQQIYPPLSYREISVMEESINIKMPKVLVDFYCEMNGFTIFCGKFSVFGLRKVISRNISAAWQPFSIDTTNNEERPANAKDKDIFIGFYSETGNLAYMDGETEQIYICTSDNTEAIKSWNNLFEFFKEELVNLFSTFDLKYFPKQT